MKWRQNEQSRVERLLLYDRHFSDIRSWTWCILLHRLVCSIVGWLASLVPSYRCTCLSGYTDSGWFEPGVYGVLDASSALQSGTLCCACIVEKMWITCRWPNLSHLTTRESASIEQCFHLHCHLMVVLSEGHDLCRHATERVVSEICEIGEQGGLIVDRSLVSRLSTPKASLDGNRVNWPKLMNSRLRKQATLLVTIRRCAPRGARTESSYLVDPASSHMLVSKIKPCMSKYKQICTVKLRMAH
jgi:hypothetical protein